MRRRCRIPRTSGGQTSAYRTQERENSINRPLDQVLKQHATGCGVARSQGEVVLEEHKAAIERERAPVRDRSAAWLRVYVSQARGICGNYVHESKRERDQRRSPIRGLVMKMQKTVALANQGANEQVGWSSSSNSNVAQEREKEQSNNSRAPQREKGFSVSASVAGTRESRLAAKSQRQ